LVVLLITEYNRFVRGFSSSSKSEHIE